MNLLVSNRLFFNRADIEETDFPLFSIISYPERLQTYDVCPNIYDLNT